MADGLGFICFGDLNVQVIHIALKNQKGALGVGDNLLTMGHRLSQLGKQEEQGLLGGQGISD